MNLEIDEFCLLLVPATQKDINLQEQVRYTSRLAVTTDMVGISTGLHRRTTFPFSISIKVSPAK